MKTGLLRLESTVSNGVGGTEAGMISLIYSFLLQEYGLNNYKYIHINQIGNDVDEVILKKGKEVYINLRFPPPPNFNSMSKDEKNNIRLAIVHSALIRVADKDRLLDVDKLELIKERILGSNFKFELIYKCVPAKENETSVNIVIEPLPEKFRFFAIVSDGQATTCRALLYDGKPTDYYIDDLFSIVKWKGKEKVIVSGNQSEIEIHVNIADCNVDYVKKVQNTATPEIFSLCKF